MSRWRKAADLVVTILLALILAVAVLGFFLVEDRAGSGYVAIGLVLFFGSFVKLGAVAFLRLRDGQYAAAAQDPRETMRLSRPDTDARAMIACMWAAVLGSGLISLGGAETSFGVLMPLVALALFGGLAIVMTRAFIRKGPLRLVLSPDGLQSNRFGDVTIAWPDIRSAELRRFGRFGTLKVILLKLVDEAKYLPRGNQPAWAWGDRLILGTSFAIPLSLDVSAKLVLRAIKARLSAFGSAAPANSAMKETR